MNEILVRETSRTAACRTIPCPGLFVLQGQIRTCSCGRYRTAQEARAAFDASGVAVAVGKSAIDPGALFYGRIVLGWGRVDTGVQGSRHVGEGIYNTDILVKVMPRDTLIEERIYAVLVTVGAP